LKLLRNTEDGLTGIILLDDSLIVRHFCQKEYGNPTGAHIRIEVLKDDPAEPFDIEDTILDLFPLEVFPNNSLCEKEKEANE